MNYSIIILSVLDITHFNKNDVIRTCSIHLPIVHKITAHVRIIKHNFAKIQKIFSKKSTILSTIKLSIVLINIIVN